MYNSPAKGIKTDISSITGGYMNQGTYKRYLQKELLKINTKLAEFTPKVEKDRREMAEKHKRLWNLSK